MKSFVLTRFATSNLTHFTDHKFENLSKDSHMEQNKNDTGKDNFWLENVFVGTVNL
jgi:hypothetical protein